MPTSGANFVPNTTDRAPGGVGACRLCQPSLFQQGVVGAFAQGFGLLTSDFGVGTSQDLGFLPFLTWLDQVPESVCRWPQVFNNQAIRLRPMTLFNPVFNFLTP